MHYRTWSVPHPEAVLVFLHGRGQQSADYHRFGRALARDGIETWALDHLGHGLSEGDPVVPAPITQLAANTLRLIGLAHAARPAQSIVLMGHSLGSASALAAMRSDAPEVSAIAAVVLCGTPNSVAEQDVRHPSVPTLVLHGADDRIAGVEQVRRWAAAGRGVVLREYGDAGHDLLHEPVRDIVTGVVAEFTLAAASFSGSTAD